MSTLRRTAQETCREGTREAVKLLRPLIGQLEVDVSTLVLILVHRTTRNPEIRAIARPASGEWSLALGNRENTLQLLREQGTDVATLADRVAVVVCAGNKQLLTFIDPVDLLPPSDFGVLTENADGSYELTLRQLLLTTYWEDEDEGTSGELSAILQAFREAVRGAVAAELATPGPKRQLIEITFEVGGGPALEANCGPGERPTPYEIARSLERKSN